MAGSSLARILLITALVICLPLPYFYVIGQSTHDTADGYAISVPGDERHQVHAARPLDVMAYFPLTASGIWKPEDGRQKKLSSHSAFIRLLPIFKVNLRE